MKLPVSISPRFIGKLMALEAASKQSNRVAWHHLSRAVKQCRTYNRSTDQQIRSTASSCGRAWTGPGKNSPNSASWLDSDQGRRLMTCRICGDGTDDLRMGVCFDCATAGDIRLAKKSTLQHWTHGIGSVFQGVWWRARMDFKMGWERIWRTGEYAPGREWQDY